MDFTSWLHLQALPSAIFTDLSRLINLMAAKTLANSKVPFYVNIETHTITIATYGALEPFLQCFT